MKALLVRLALLALPAGYRRRHEAEVVGTLDELAAASQLSSWRETRDLTLLGLRLRARTATHDGQRAWRAGLHAGGTACLLVSLALAALRLGAGLKTLGNPFASALAFLPTGGWHLGVEVAIVASSVLFLSRPSQLPRLVYATAVLASLGAVWWLPATDRLAGFGFASFGLVGVLLADIGERETRRGAAVAATAGAVAFVAFSLVMHGGNGGIAVSPGIGSSDLLVRALPFAAIALLAILPLAVVDARPVIAATVVTIPLLATLCGILLLGQNRLLARGHTLLGVDGLRRVPAQVEAFEGRLHQGIAVDLSIGLVLLVVAALSVNHHRRLSKG